MQTTRREFLAASGAAMGMLALPALPLALPAPLKLYTVCDAAYDPVYFEGWCDAVWARSERQALEWAQDNYGGEWCPYRGEAYPPLKVLAECTIPDPDAVELQRENRLSWLRLAGWGEESDNQCGCCGLHDFAEPEWAVCCECYCCPACADGECSLCGPEQLTKGARLTVVLAL